MRIGRDQWGLQLAELTALRSTCLRRSVGCVLTDARGVVLATGYNGVPRGAPHCNDAFVEFAGTIDVPTPGVAARGFLTKTTHPHACPGAGAPSGTDLEACHAVHAEANALTFCPDAGAVDTCYTTVSPCLWCVRMLLNTRCRRVVFREEYPHPAKAEWLAMGREWVRLPPA